ncbi:peptidase M56 family protein [Agromyces sp. SYSU K20354]|uniref:peptidase M56 family protein n=1 Tax=Agromyces cavernae TaxID=2898659 RepID=UPI001E2D139D|nr:peptidase M56 family protein [Agromyces cavernae]MCD2440771.1 peptidase M56 family protein [Agromyces cavernae]
MSDEFRQALRTELVHRAEHARVRRWRRRWQWIGGGTLGVLLAGGATFAAADLFSQPGGPVTSTVADEITVTGTGTRTIDLGPAPESATSVWVDVTCLTAATYELGAGGAALTCTADDAGTETGRAFGPFPLSVLRDDAFTLATGPDAAWELTLAYVNEQSTDWAMNESGQTYGIGNGNGSPDLIAVIATNGREGYVHRADLEEADGTAAARGFTSPEDALRWQEERAGKSFTIQVYEADGTTPIGEFTIGPSSGPPADAPQG